MRVDEIINGLKKIEQDPKNKDIIEEETNTYDCEICRDLEWIDSENGMIPCKCQAIKNYKRRLKRCGLEGIIDDYTLDNYKTDTDVRRINKEIAKRYIDRKHYIKTDRGEQKNLLFLGQSGSGKTHLALAITREILLQGVDVYYMQYRDYMSNMKNTMYSDSEEYNKLLQIAKTTKVLLIDDLYKGRVKGKNGSVVSDLEINIIYEIINYRTLKKLATIVTSEMSIEEIMAVDEAIGSRLYNRGKDAKITMPNINYRTTNKAKNKF